MAATFSAVKKNQLNILCLTQYMAIIKVFLIFLLLGILDEDPIKQSAH